MKYVELTYDPETGFFFNGAVRVPGCRRGGNHGKGGEYLGVRHGGKIYYAHRLAFLLMTGKDPAGQVDHINGDKLDNRWCNLRLANASLNKGNEGLRSTNTSGLKGVCWHKGAGKWMARAGDHRSGHHVYLGLFTCPAAAHFAYLIAAHEIYGDFMRGS